MASVMVVDDDEDMRMLLCLFLDRPEDEGLGVVAAASDGVEAEEVFFALAEPPDALILDGRMPRQNGPETAQHILAERPCQLILLCSAHLDDCLRKHADEIGISACVSKGEMKTLPVLVKSLLKPVGSLGNWCDTCPVVTCGHRAGRVPT